MVTTTVLDGNPEAYPGTGVVHGADSCSVEKDQFRRGLRRTPVGFEGLLGAVGTGFPKGSVRTSSLRRDDPLNPRLETSVVHRSS